MADEAQAPQTESAGKKTRKINKLSSDDLDKKIQELQEKNGTKSVYYKHLVARKNQQKPQ